ncbi:hypothetical protein BG011_008731 [Mortierella polycephala]|uniref:Uncharacterized protein n=1 Tax=Mortierella polycephala TaxID=41804 RepID=A0A9P6PPY2_9FUNG|nr:hypothetical protein BG011_008731 [Mortierella polycephala]
MPKTESMLFDLASNGRANSYPTLNPQQHQQQLQMAQLQAPHLNNKSYNKSYNNAEPETDSQAQDSFKDDPFETMVPNPRYSSRNGRAPRSKL